MPRPRAGVAIARVPAPRGAPAAGRGRARSADSAGVRSDDQGCGRLWTGILAWSARSLPSVRAGAALPARLSYRAGGQALLAELTPAQLTAGLFSPAVLLFDRLTPRSFASVAPSPACAM